MLRKIKIDWFIYNKNKIILIINFKNLLNQNDINYIIIILLLKLHIYFIINVYICYKKLYNNIFFINYIKINHYFNKS